MMLMDSAFEQLPIKCSSSRESTLSREREPSLSRERKSSPSRKREPSSSRIASWSRIISVPFQWEEAPGRLRPCLPQSPYLPTAVSGGAKRHLDFPPRLLHDKQSTATTTTNHVTILRPTTVLEGPYSCHRKKLANTWSFRQVGSRERIAFGSTRWAGLRFGSGVPFHERKEVRGGDHKCGFGISLSEFFRCDCDQDVTGDGNTKVKITRIRRRRSFPSLSPKNSHLWASIYEGLKQVVPWRLRPTPTPEANRNRRSSSMTTTMKLS